MIFIYSSNFFSDINVDIQQFD